MKMIRKSLTIVGSIFIAGLVLAALTPRAARGLAAALVQIANTDASPVPTEDHARQAIVLTAFAPDSLGVNPISFTNTDGSAFSIPADKRLVIEQVNGEVELPGGSFVAGALLRGRLKSGSTYENFLTAPALTAAGDISQFRFSQSVRFYTDDPPSIEFTNSAAGTLIITASGYFVDCTGACQ